MPYFCYFNFPDYFLFAEKLKKLFCPDPKMTLETAKTTETEALRAIIKTDTVDKISNLV